MYVKQTLEIKDGKYFLQVLGQAIGQLGDTMETWWRGHASSSPTWKLIPKVYRDPENHGYCYEQNVANNFRRQAPARYQNCPTSDIDWLFLMQHYGASTRLLDWTVSPLVALFFAVSYEYEKYESEPATLWAMNPMWLNKGMGYNAGIQTLPTEDIENMARAAFGADQDSEDKILPMYPPHRDLRMLIQQAAITIHGKETPLEEQEVSKEFLIRINIPSEQKEAIRIGLQIFHINSSTLFPDLEHLAEEVSSYKYISGERDDEQGKSPE